MPVMKTVTFYTKPDCGLCREVERILGNVAAQVSFERQTVDITQNEAAWQRYALHIPVVEIDGVEHARHRINEADLLNALRS